MDASAKITLKGKEYLLKFGLLTTRRLRIRHADLSVIDSFQLDELLILLVSIALPEVDHFWTSEEELLGLLDENAPEDLNKVINAFNLSMGFIQTVAGISPDVEDEAKKGEKGKK